MSQHTFTATTHNGRDVEVLTGWDRPLQGFFLVVQEVGARDDRYVFSNLDLPVWESHPRDFDGFMRVLADLGIKVPQGLLEELLLDAALNVGNKCKAWEN